MGVLLDREFKHDLVWATFHEKTYILCLTRSGGVRLKDDRLDFEKEINILFPAQVSQ
jgi:hypothetical protein